MAGIDRCVQHAGLPPTQAQQEGPRDNALKHGAYVRGLRPAELPQYREYFDRVHEPDPIKRDHVARALVRRDRLMEAEAKAEEAGPVLGHAAHALDAATRILERLPAQEAAPQQEDPVLVARIAATLARDPTVVLKGLRPEDQEEIKAILRRAGALP
jgi:hypothetical protein